MKKQIHLLIIITIGFLSCCSINARTQAWIDLESGALFTGYNNVRIPGNTGTLFSMKSDLEPAPQAFLRLRLGYTIKSRHTLSLLYTPLTVTANGSCDRPISFEGLSFPASNELEGKYTFNSYRITYRYALVRKPTLEVGLGFTAKIRDAAISLSNENDFSSKTNVGFVPIINFKVHWKVNERTGLLLQGDALAAPQGRAEDVILAGTYALTDHFICRIGYRILEGGADNAEVYNFALFHYAAIGVSWQIVIE